MVEFILGLIVGSSGVLLLFNENILSIRNWFCNHYFIFEKNIYGDNINLYNARSEWKCVKCNKRKYEKKLYMGEIKK